AGPVRRSGPDGEMGGPEPRREAPALFDGFGGGLAVVGAYLLAGELTAAAGDHRAAFAGYDRRMRAYAGVARSGNAGRFLAPRTRAGIRARDALFRLGPLRRALMSTTDGFADGIESE